MSKVHNHPPYRPACNERLAGACMVVIDPDDRSAAVDLAQAIGSVWASPGQDISKIIAATQTWLRKMADPKPDEPTGLGAVVEDAGGVRWVKVFDNGSMWQDNRDRGTWQTYEDIAAVKVLSEGWSA